MRLELDASELDGIFASVKMGTIATPGGITAIDDIMTMDNVTIDNGIYDLYGRRVSGQPRKGIYIKNKKKIHYSY